MVERRYENGIESEGGRISSPREMSCSPERKSGGYHHSRNRYPAAGRIYVGNLPPNVNKRMIEDIFCKCGRICDVSLKKTVSGSPFAFVEFEDPRDASDAIKERDCYKIDGCVLRVETPFASRGGGSGRPHTRKGPPRRGDYRVAIKGLPPSGSWQDLKDHMREAGDCVYADVFRDGTGVVEFARKDDMEYALRKFIDSKFRSHEGEISHITVNPIDPDYDRHSAERSRMRRSRSWERGSRGYNRGYYGRGYESSHRSYDRYYKRDRRERSHSRGRPSISYERRSRSRSRSFRGHR